MKFKLLLMWLILILSVATITLAGVINSVGLTVGNCVYNSSGMFCNNEVIAQKAYDIVICKSEQNYDTSGCDLVCTNSTRCDDVIQQAVNMLPDFGGIIKIRRGVYNFSSSVNITKHAVYLEGVEYSQTYGDQPTYQNGTALTVFHANTALNDYFIRWGNSTAIMWNEGGVKNIVFRGAFGTGNYGAKGGIYDYNTHALRIRDNVFERIGGFAFVADSNVAGFISACRVDNNLFRENLNRSIYMIQAGESWVTNNYISSPREQAILSTADDVVISGNFIESTQSTGASGSGTAIYVTAPSNIITNNIISSTDYHGIYFADSGTIVTNNYIVNVNTDGNADGSAIYSTGNNRRGIINNNFIYDTNNKMRYGINIWTTNSQFEVYGNQIITGAIGQKYRLYNNNNSYMPDYVYNSTASALTCSNTSALWDKTIINMTPDSLTLQQCKCFNNNWKCSPAMS